MKIHPYIIIGGGASGLMSAILLAQKGKEVLVLEKNAQIGKKITISGNGKCNITHAHITPHRFHSQNPHFAQNIIVEYPYIKGLLESLGIFTHEGKEGRIYPMSQNAASVVDILEYQALHLGVKIEKHQEVLDVKKEKFFTLTTPSDSFLAHKLVIASGNLAYPQLGSSDIGLTIAQSFHHPIIPPLPSLVQLTSPQKEIYQLAGYKQIATLTLYCNGDQKAQTTGDILFASYGVSGLAVLDMSRFASLALSHYEHCAIKADLMPHWSKKALHNLLQSTLPNDKPIALWLEGFIHKKLARVILGRLKLTVQTTQSLNAKHINAMVYELKNFEIEINGTQGFKGAEVAMGGVDTTTINPQTMESKLLKNLYFVGEVLDVDGDRGGFNLHFAWSSAIQLARGL